MFCSCSCLPLLPMDSVGPINLNTRLFRQIITQHYQVVFNLSSRLGVYKTNNIQQYPKVSLQCLNSCIIYLKSFLSGWLHATRFFQSIGLLMSLASFVSSLCCTFVNITDRKRHAQVAAAVMNFVTGILTLQVEKPWSLSLEQRSQYCQYNWIFYKKRIIIIIQTKANSPFPFYYSWQYVNWNQYLRWSVPICNLAEGLPSFLVFCFFHFSRNCSFGLWSYIYSYTTEFR